MVLGHLVIRGTGSRHRGLGGIARHVDHLEVIPFLLEVDVDLGGDRRDLVEDGGLGVYSHLSGPCSARRVSRT